MPSATESTGRTSRTAQLIALMTKGDDAFNDRDFEVLDDAHHPDMIAFITGNAQPIYGRAAHTAAIREMLRIFPDIHVHTPYPFQFGDGDWITVVTRVTGTFKGEMTLPEGKVIPPTGKAFTSSSARRPSGRAISLSGFQPSGIRRCRPDRWASVSRCYAPT